MFSCATRSTELSSDSEHSSSSESERSSESESGWTRTAAVSSMVLEAPLALKRPAIRDSALSMVVAPVRVAAGSVLCTAEPMRACPAAGFSVSSARDAASALAALAALALALLADLEWAR